MARLARGSTTVLTAFALWIALPAFLVAQTTGGLRGVVSDETGNPIEGVTIVVSSVAQSLTGRGAVTDIAGTFHINSLPSAPDYTIVATYPGYAPVSLTDVSLQGGQTVNIRIALQKETSYKERIEVRAKPQIIAMESTTTETRLSSEFIDGLPILGRNYQDVLALAPGVTDVNGTGNPNIHGARDTDVITLVDGVSTTDPLTGKIGAQLNIESIQEIEIKTSGATAEFSRAQGGFANIITKSGGNDFQGTFKMFWRGRALDGDGAGIDDPRLHNGVGSKVLKDLKFNDFLPFLSFEGPIVRDHAWFFVANEYVQTEEPVNALSNAFIAGVRELREFAKLTWQLSANHRLNLSVNYDPQEFLNQGLNSFTREESGLTVRQGGPIVTLKEVAVFNPYMSLESSVSSFNERPSQAPTLDPDTNGNGVLFTDRNGNGFIEATEGDSGEDFDQDGNFDVHENAITGDVDRDGRVTLPGRGQGTGQWGPLLSPGGCEGVHREDADCDGRLDNLDEDPNHNGRCDPGEPCDIDHDGVLEHGTEDRNHNHILDDTPAPKTLYPYGELRPVPPDRDYTIDQQTRVISGPYFEDFSDRRKRATLREDLSIYLPDFWGSHDFKLGGVVERESFSRIVVGRPVLAPNIVRPISGQASTVRALVPAQRDLQNQATGVTGGIYIQDTYKPFPNLSIGLGLRFDREATDSFGYSFFDPAKERASYDQMGQLFGSERGQDDSTQGNGDGIVSNGYCADPIFIGLGGGPCGSNATQNAVVSDLDNLKRLAVSRLTRHHTEAFFTSQDLVSLFPGLVVNGEVDARQLAALGVLAQRPEAFRLTNNNLSPRLSISWDPWSDGRTKVFATWGRYYDKLFLNTIVGEEGPDDLNRYYLYDPSGVTGNGAPDHNIGRVISKAPPSTTQVDRGLQTPFSDEFTLGFERELAPEVAISVTYINRHYRDQLQDIDVNHTLRTDASGQPFDRLGRFVAARNDFIPSIPVPDGRPDLYIQDFFFNQVLRLGNYNQARYHGIEVALVKRLARRWELQGSYTYSRAVGAAEDFQSRLGNDPSTIESEFGYLDFDQRHVIKLNTITFLPGDWQLGFSSSWTSGLPYSVISKFFAADNVGYLQYRTRFGFTLPAGGGNASRFVTLKRNSMRNDSVLDLNARAKKTLVIGKTTAALFMEVFNILNTDDLRIFTYEPTAPDRFNAGDTSGQGPLQLDARRRFGRRFQVGLQFDF